MESLRLTTTFPTTAEDVYDAWLDPKRHAEMTGTASATSEKKKGGAYSASDGYITGKYLELHPDERIVMTWRTNEFPEGAPDSKLEIRLASSGKKTRLTLLQSGIPDGQGEMYADGWQMNYFQPMTRYFASAKKTAPAAKAPARAAKKKPPAKKPAKPGKPTKSARKPAPAKKAPQKKSPKKRSARRRG